MFFLKGGLELVGRCLLNWVWSDTFELDGLISFWRWDLAVREGNSTRRSYKSLFSVIIFSVVPFLEQNLLFWLHAMYEDSDKSRSMSFKLV